MHGVWMFRLRSLYEENIPYFQVFKSKWCVRINVGYTQTHNYKFCSTLKDKCIIEEILLKGAESLLSVHAVIL